jgi:hypothetical protein
MRELSGGDDSEYVYDSELFVLSGRSSRSRCRFAKPEIEYGAINLMSECDATWDREWRKACYKLGESRCNPGGCLWLSMQLPIRLTIASGIAFAQIC